MNKPFTPNASKKNAKMSEAARHIQAAIESLQQAGKCSENWSEYETLLHFEYQLNEFMNCGSGEAGFEPYMAQKTRQSGTHFNRNGRAIRMSVPVE
jgi:hypothetical protein